MPRPTSRVMGEPKTTEQVKTFLRGDSGTHPTDEGALYYDPITNEEITAEDGGKLADLLEERAPVGLMSKDFLLAAQKANKWGGTKLRNVAAEGDWNGISLSAADVRPEDYATWRRTVIEAFAHPHYKTKPVSKNGNQPYEVEGDRGVVCLGMHTDQEGAAPHLQLLVHAHALKRNEAGEIVEVSTKVTFNREHFLKPEEAALNAALENAGFAGNITILSRGQSSRTVESAEAAEIVDTEMRRAELSGDTPELTVESIETRAPEILTDAGAIAIFEEIREKRQAEAKKLVEQANDALREKKAFDDAIEAIDEAGKLRRELDTTKTALNDEKLAAEKAREEHAETLNAKNVELETVRNELTETKETLAGAQDDYANAQEELTEKTAALESATVELADTREKLGAAVEDVASLAQTVVDRDAVILAEKTARGLAEAEVEALAVEVEKKDQELEAEKKARSSAEAELATLRARVAAAEQERDAERAARTKAEAEAKAQAARADKADEAKERAEKRAEQSEQRRDHLEDRLEKAEDKAQKAELDAANEAGRANVANERVRGLEDTLRQVQALADEHAREVADQAKRIQDLENGISAKDKTIAQQIEDIRNEQAKTAELGKTLAEVMAEINRRDNTPGGNTPGGTGGPGGSGPSGV